MSTTAIEAARPREVSGEPESQRSSCEIKTSTRGTDITVKVYAGSPVHDACNEALGEYFWTFDHVAAGLLSRGVRQ